MWCTQMISRVENIHFCFTHLRIITQSLQVFLHFWSFQPPQKGFYPLPLSLRFFLLCYIFSWISLWFLMRGIGKSRGGTILVPDQDVHIFYTRYHLSAPQSCVLIFSINFHSIFILKSCMTQCSPWIFPCTIVLYLL